jgi:putative MATE family efflux protein
MRQALPILIVLAVQTMVSVAETYFVGRLGTEPLAGMAVVFPVLTLMTMVSNGGMGGGVSSAVARALGEKRAADANALVLHTLLIAIVCGMLCTAGAWVFGPTLYAKMGGSGGALDNALRYSNLVFAAAVPIWIVNLLSAALRGAGNVRTPALLVLAGAGVTLALSPLLIFGAGPMPGLGIAGAGLAMIVYYSGATIALLAYMSSKRSPLRLTRAPFEGRLLKAVLAVGIPASLGALQSNLIVVIFTAMVGHFGALALAGYGIASRLDYVLIPLLFALGTASVAIVGMNVGAGQYRRARQVALTAAGLSAAIVTVIGLAAAVWPQAWVTVFTADREVIAFGAAYLTRVAPFYAFTGIGMALIFASQGARVVVAPLLIGTCVLVFSAVASWYCVAVVGGTVESLFWVVAGGRALFGVLMLAVLLMAPGWKAGAGRGAGTGFC